MRKKIGMMIGLSAVLTLSAFGQKEVLADTKENKEVVCNVGSVSKTFVTVCALQLAEQGKLELDAPVVTYIPEFKMEDERYKDITVRMLMNHSSGLMGTTYADSFLYDDNDMMAHDLLLSRLAKQKLKADPGAYSVYCNDGFWLLELVVERVSGESFTDYLKNHIEIPLGLNKTGTGVDMFRREDAINIFINGNKYASEYCMDLGSGGVMSTASELSKYGTAFFHGNNILLSEESKKAMSKCQTTREYDTKYGLGWDYVEKDRYKEKGVEILEKGGSTAHQFADLLVSPNEEISVAVLSSGDNGAASTMLANELMTKVLEMKGIQIEDTKITELPTVDRIPEEYLKYEGVYSAGKEVFTLSFEDNMYMKLSTSETTPVVNYYYKLTEDGRFVLMENDLSKNRQAHDQEILKFEDDVDGKVMILKESKTDYTDFMVNHEKQYYAEKVENNDVSQEVKDYWKSMEGDYRMITGKYSTASLDLLGPLKIRPSKTMDGYMYIDGEGLLKMTEGTVLEPFVTIPCQNSRDIFALKGMKEEGACYLMLGDESVTYMRDDAMEFFDPSMKKVALETDHTKWFKLDERTKGVTIMLDKPEKCAIYVYDQYDKIVYSSYMVEYGNEVALPTEGKIAFVGYTGDVVEIN